ncbi:hypothetical protein ACFVZH_37530 [Streptomyces sp. NPDC059534]|uniref:hypothetical protein n=1 Tax=Streptomyces sp. NPDC059534 TaxID=3346859 RepID=UPI0036C53F38
MHRGGKNIENRPRPWRPGWYLLHTGQDLDRSALRDPLLSRAIRGRELATGAVLGIVRVAACHQDPDGAKLCTPWAFPGPLWHIELADFHELPLPVPRPASSVRGGRRRTLWNKSSTSHRSDGIAPPSYLGLSRK